MYESRHTWHALEKRKPFSPMGCSTDVFRCLGKHQYYKSSLYKKMAKRSVIDGGPDVWEPTTM